MFCSFEMKNISKKLLLLLFFILNSNFSKIKIVTSICSIGDIAQKILGNSGEAINLADGRFDLHKIEPRPSFLFHLSRADFVIPVGMRLDTWFLSLIDSARNPKIYPGEQGFIVLYDKLEILEIPSPDIKKVGDIHAEGNPHYWLLPDNAQKIAKIISQKLERTYHSPIFKENEKKFSEEIEKLKRELKQEFKPFEGVEVIAYHNSWRYFEKFLGFKVVEFLEPAPGIPPTPSQIQKVIDTIKGKGIKVLIYEPFQPLSPIKSVSEKTGIKPVELYQDCVPKISEVKDYISLLRYNTKKLVEALKDD